jgi:hypothetical protein
VGFFGQMAIGYKGIPGQEKYQAYKYPMTPEVLETDYGSFLTEYWWTIYRFVEDICENIDRDSELITHWAQSISHYVPGFPTGDEIRLKDNLERALTSYIHTCSVSHAADHYTYSRIPLRHAPLRNRVPFPEKHIMNFKFDINKVVTKEDFIRHKFCNIMYFKENNLTLLKDCDYAFRSSKLETAVQRFRADLVKTEKIFQDNNYIPLGEISASIQY